MVGEVLHSGIPLGLIYAILALGFVVIYRCTGVVNFAHGAFVALGVYAAIDFSTMRGGSVLLLALVGVAGILRLISRVSRRWSQRWGAGGPHVQRPTDVVLLALAGGLGLGAGLLGSIALGLLGGALFVVTMARAIERRLIGPLSGTTSVFALIVLTLGLDIVVRTLLEVRYGARPYSIPTIAGTVDVFGLSLQAGRVVAGLTGVFVFAVFGVLFGRSFTGLEMQAVGQDEEAALAVGVDVERTRAFAWGLSGLLAAVGGILMVTTLHGNFADPGLATVGLRAFPAAILGGLDSPRGALVGGVLMGLLETTVAFTQPELFSWAGSGIHTVVPFAVMILILLVRPYGLFGRVRLDRA